MHLKQLDIIGFKSFVEASISFGTGITALVGPNGTGKSNLVDAVLWALGEQSQKSLRIERMEDTIFNGAASKPPLGMAEVVLTLTDLPNDQEDVTISRRLYRDGQSEYAINKKSCRLRDVRDLFFDLGANSKGCTIIEQGKLDTLLQSSPQDRRTMIEEAAGTMRYKKQRAATMQKIEACQGNLLRLRDLISELKRQQSSLKRQAKAAETYKTIHEEIRTLELSLVKHDYEEHRDHLDAIEAQIDTATEQENDLSIKLTNFATDREHAKRLEAEASAQLTEEKDAATASKILHERALEAVERQHTLLKMCEAQLQQVTTSLAQIEYDAQRDEERQKDCNASLDTLQHDFESTEAILTSQEQELKTAQDQQRTIHTTMEELRAKTMKVLTEENTEAQTISALETREQELLSRQEYNQNNHATLTRTITHTTEHQSELTAQISNIKRRWEHHQSRIKEHEKVLEKLHHSSLHHVEEERAANEHVTALESRRTALQGVLAEQWSSYGEQGPKLASEEIRGAIAEVLKVPPQYERAIEVALGERLRGVIVDSHSQARDAIKTLRKQGLSLGTFIPLHPRKQAPLKTLGNSLPGVVANAREVVTTTTEFEHIIDYLLNTVVIVENLDSALELWEKQPTHLNNQLPDQAIFVTLDGEYVDAGGIVGVGSVPSAMGLLERQREVKGIDDLLSTATTQAAAAQQQCEEITTNIENQNQQKLSDEGAAREEELHLLNAQKDKERTDQELLRLKEDAQRLTQSLETDQRALTSLKGELLEARQKKETLIKHRQEVDQLLIQHQQSSVRSEDILQRSLEQVNHTRLTQHTLSSRRDTLQAEIQTLQQATQDRKEKTTHLKNEQHRMTEQSNSAQADTTQLKESIDQLNAEINSHDSKVSAAQANLDQMIALTRTQDTAHTNTQKSLEEVRQTLNDYAVNRMEHTTSLDHLENLLSGTYETSIDAVREKLGDVNIDLELTRTTLSQRRQRRDRLGPINLAAAEEAQALDERVLFLTAEENDLLQSIASLEEIMTRLNDTTSQLFKETFHALRKTFNDLFSRLFEGGMADLILDDPDPITAGVDIVAQPPGKRLKQLSMLSGGEKALTAFALILASYVIRPTPLCVLDETDAPLDDENVARFIRVVQEVSESAQFLLITHNKQTMAAADKLYGTTMAEPGITMLLSATLENENQQT